MRNLTSCRFEEGTPARSKMSLEAVGSVKWVRAVRQRPAKGTTGGEDDHQVLRRVKEGRDVQPIVPQDFSWA